MVRVKIITGTPTTNAVRMIQSLLNDLSGTERENDYYYFYNKDENNNNESKTHPNTFIINMT